AVDHYVGVVDAVHAACEQSAAGASRLDRGGVRVRGVYDAGRGEVAHRVLLEPIRPAAGGYEPGSVRRDGDVVDVRHVGRVVDLQCRRRTRQIDAPDRDRRVARCVHEDGVRVGGIADETRGVGIEGIRVRGL